MKKSTIEFIFETLVHQQFDSELKKLSYIEENIFKLDEGSFCVVKSFEPVGVKNKADIADYCRRKKRELTELKTAKK